MEAMTKILAKEMKGTGITVNCIAPGPIATEMVFEGKTPERIQAAFEECPHGRLGKVEDVAPMVGFLVVMLRSGLMARLFELWWLCVNWNSHAKDCI